MGPTVRKREADPRRGAAAAAGLLACVMLAGCMDEGPYADESGLPQATYYTVIVRPGDTLSQIAARYDASTGDVAALNRLEDGSRIRPGQILRIPASGEKTRDAVLAEAGDSSVHNYAPPPDPIDVDRFTPRAQVSVRTLSPVPQAKPEAANQLAGEDAPLDADAGASARDAARFAWPIRGPVISPFGIVGNGERNDGINIAAEAGTPIHAAAAGTVTYAGDKLKGYGNLVLIQHGDGYITAYAHAETISVSRGEHVAMGQVIGFAGATGDVDRPQLHFEIRKDAHPVNPRLLLASRT